jgi:serine/threonine-protein kinase
MGYPGGDTLRERLERQVRLTPDEAVRIGLDVAGALDYAHRQGVVHRDLRPENILLVDDRAVIANFGLARALDQAAGTRLTATGILVGSPGYMSPELALGEGGLDARSDLYSLGCVLHEMLTGQPVHTGPTPQAILARRMALGKQPSSPAMRLLPPGLGPVIQRALAPLPADRYQTAGELAEGLKQPATQTPAAGAAEVGPMTRGLSARVIGIAATVFLLLLAGLLLFR